MIEAGGPADDTFVRVWREACAQNEKKPFLITQKQTLSYAQADRQATELAAGLLALGAGKGSRIAIWMPNGPEWVIALLAVTRIGAIAVPLSTFYQAPELAWALQHNDIHTLLMTSRYINHDYIERVVAAIPGLAETGRKPLGRPDFPFLRNVVVWGADGLDWAYNGAALHETTESNAGPWREIAAASEAQVGPNDDCIVINTSGSTARPKAVVHTHESTVHATRAIAANIPMIPDEVTYTGYPFFWIAGLNMTLFPTIYAGAAMAFASTHKPGDAIQIINYAGVTRLVLPPAQVAQFFAAAGPDDLRKVRKLANCAPEERQKVFGTNRGQAFGMTESFGMHSMEPEGPVPEGKTGAMGRAVKGIERVIRDRSTGENVPTGENGELLIRGANIMRGYHKVSRRQVFDDDGYFHTGDQGMIDADGFFWFSGRANELIKSAGANVAPREVELALEELEDVSQAFVFSIPDDALGEAVTAVIVANSSDVSAVGLRSQLATRISSYKIPSHFYLLEPDDLPEAAPWKSARELVDKRKLREKILAGAGQPLPA